MSKLHYANTKDSNMLYLVQHIIPDSFFFLETKNKKYIFLSKTDIDTFKTQNKTDIEVVDVDIFKSKTSNQTDNFLGNLALTILEHYDITDEIIVPTNFPLAIADTVRLKIPQLTTVLNWLPKRVIKTTNEITCVKENFSYTKKAFEYVEKVLNDSKIVGNKIEYRGNILTSEFLKREVSKLLFDYDLVNTEEIIISSGKCSTMPHNTGIGPILSNQTIIVDIFPQSSKNHYFADMTRTYVKGESSDEIIKMYEAVSKAQKASISVLCPGVSCKEAYEISAEVIREHGFEVGEKGYIHSLGHGLGVAIHEAPILSSKSEAVLETGNIITIEPGLYYPDIGGVRIEDTVVITENGYENLTNYPQNWLIA